MKLGPSRVTEGAGEITAPFGEVTVLKTFTCGHCGKIGFVEPEKAPAQFLIVRSFEPPAVCQRCWMPVCGPCHADGRCTPLEARLEAEESRERFLKSAGFVENA